MIIEVNRTKIIRKRPIQQTTATKSPQERRGVNSIATAGASLRQHTTTNNSIATAQGSEDSCHRTEATTKKRNKSDNEGPWMVSTRS
jgi:hypothetical protein